MTGNFAMFSVSLGNGFIHALTCSRKHFQVNRKFASILDFDPMFCRISVEDRRNVVLGMASSKEHTRHRKNVIDALFAQLIKTCFDDRCREFKIAIFHRPVREFWGEFFRKNSKFSNSRFRTAAMAANHHTIFWRVL